MKCRRCKTCLRTFWTVIIYSVFSGISVSAENSASPDVASVATLLHETLIDIWKGFVSHIPHLAASVIVLLLTWGASKIATRLLRRILKKTSFRSSLRVLAYRFTEICVWVSGVLVAAMIVFPGLTPSKALGAMGIASIAVGFAFKDIFENFFAGVLILWRFPFEQGDFITCQDITGRVEQVSVRTTELRLVSDELVVMPNSILFKNPVEILTNRKKRRMTAIAGVAYGENVEEAVDVIKEAVKRCSTVDKEKGIQVFPHAFGSSSVDIEITWWTSSPPLEIRRSRGEVITAVKAALDTAGIEIPFPYRTLTFKEPVRTEVADQ